MWPIQQLDFVPFVFALLPIAIPQGNAVPAVERWGVFELSLVDSTSGTPFLDVPLSGWFTEGSSAVTAKMLDTLNMTLTPVSGTFTLVKQTDVCSRTMMDVPSNYLVVLNSHSHQAGEAIETHTT